MIAAIEANLWAYPLFHRWARAEGHDGPDLLYAISDIAIPLFNSIGRANLGEEEADAAIESLIARAKAKHVPLLWWTSPSSRPADLGARLVAHGFRHAADHPGMALERVVDFATPDELTIEPVRDVDLLRTWNAVPNGIEERFAFYAAHLDAFRHFVGFAGGRAVATASLFLGGGAAGLYNIYTTPAVRGRGYGAALTMAAVGHARAAGIAPIVLQATPLSAPLYRRLGFVEHGAFATYVWSATG